MSALDVIVLPGHPGMFARRVAVEAWQSAGSPPVNSAGRLYAAQKRLWDGWRQRLPGFSPADNPDDETEALAHVRFVAFDIDPTADRIKRLTAAGFHRPYTYEPWHWELPNVRSYALVRAIPATASLGITRINEQEEDLDMSEIKYYTKAENGREYGIMGRDLPGGWEASTNVADGEAYGILYGTPEGAPWDELPYKKWVNAQKLAKRLSAARVAELTEIAKAAGGVSTTVNTSAVTELGPKSIAAISAARAVKLTGTLS